MSQEKAFNLAYFWGKSKKFLPNFLFFSGGKFPPPPNVPGVYLAGVVCGGFEYPRVFHRRTGIVHAESIVMWYSGENEGKKLRAEVKKAENGTIRKAKFQKDGKQAPLKNP